MQLSVREVAQALKISEKTLYRWIQEGSLPAYRVNEHYRFNRTELLEWATAHKINLPPEFAADPNDSAAAPLSLYAALEAGGIAHGLVAADKTEALKAALENMHLPEDLDRSFLLNILLARETLGSTGIGDGIAIPHVRSPVVLPVLQTHVSLAFLAHPIPFDAIDGKPVHCLFTLVCPTIRSHLAMLGRLSYLLRTPSLRSLIDRQAPATEILPEIRRIEEQLSAPKGAAS